MLRHLALSLLLAAAPVPLFPQAQAPASSPSGNASLAAQLAKIRATYHLPALGGAIVTSQGMVEMAVTGVRKTGTTVPATVNDLWHLGSDTKAMTAVLLATLVERGQLKWDTTIEQAVPDLTPRAPEAFRKITLLQLMSHQAGLPPNINWQQASTSAASPRAQRLTALTIAATAPLSSPPGTKFEYSNLGYVLAGLIAERVANKPWENLIREIVFTPLGMAHAGFGGTGTPGQIDQPWPHTENGEPAPQNGPGMDNLEVMGPAGTVHCTLEDWGRFIADQLKGLRGQRGLLKPETYTAMHTPPFGGTYASGWLVTERPWGGGTVYTHAGSNTMNFAVVWMAPARDFAVLVVTNQAGPEAQKACDEAASAMILDRTRK